MPIPTKTAGKGRSGIAMVSIQGDKVKVVFEDNDQVVTCLLEDCPSYIRPGRQADRKSTRLNSSHQKNSYAVFCLKKKNLEGIAIACFVYGVVMGHVGAALPAAFANSLPDVTPIVAVYNSLFFFFNDTATTEIYTLSLHDALPICWTDRLAARRGHGLRRGVRRPRDRKSTRLNSSHQKISYAVFCLKKKKKE